MNEDEEYHCCQQCDDADDTESYLNRFTQETLDDIAQAKEIVKDALFWMHRCNDYPDGLHLPDDTGVVCQMAIKDITSLTNLPYGHHLRYIEEVTQDFVEHVQGRVWKSQNKDVPKYRRPRKGVVSGLAVIPCELDPTVPEYDKERVLRRFNVRWRLLKLNNQVMKISVSQTEFVEFIVEQREQGITLLIRRGDTHTTVIDPHVVDWWLDFDSTNGHPDNVWMVDYNDTKYRVDLMTGVVHISEQDNK